MPLIDTAFPCCVEIVVDRQPRKVECPKIVKQLSETLPGMYIFELVQYMGVV